jgi:hypothetical protein
MGTHLLRSWVNDAGAGSPSAVISQSARDDLQEQQEARMHLSGLEGEHPTKPDYVFETHIYSSLSHSHEALLEIGRKVLRESLEGLASNPTPLPSTDAQPVVVEQERWMPQRFPPKEYYNSVPSAPTQPRVHVYSGDSAHRLGIPLFDRSTHNDLIHPDNSAARHVAHGTNKEAPKHLKKAYLYSSPPPPRPLKQAAQSHTTSSSNSLPFHTCESQPGRSGSSPSPSSQLILEPLVSKPLKRRRPRLKRWNAAVEADETYSTKELKKWFVPVLPLRSEEETSQIRRPEPSSPANERRRSTQDQSNNTSEIQEFSSERDPKSQEHTSEDAIETNSSTSVTKESAIMPPNRRIRALTSFPKFAIPPPKSHEPSPDRRRNHDGGQDPVAGPSTTPDSRLKRLRVLAPPSPPVLEQHSEERQVLAMLKLVSDDRALFKQPQIPLPLLQFEDVLQPPQIRSRDATFIKAESKDVKVFERMKQHLIEQTDFRPYPPDKISIFINPEVFKRYQTIPDKRIAWIVPVYGSMAPLLIEGYQDKLDQVSDATLQLSPEEQARFRLKPFVSQTKQPSVVWSSELLRSFWNVMARHAESGAFGPLTIDYRVRSNSCVYIRVECLGFLWYLVRRILASFTATPDTTPGENRPLKLPTRLLLVRAKDDDPIGAI